MSRSFIGSKIAIVTKSQCRYVGTIIGIDAEVSSILLGNVKCFGTENRGGSLSISPMSGTIVPIMQFANSDIEDLNIFDEEQPVESPKQTSKHIPVLSAPPPPQKQSSIHDDPAIVSAVISTSNRDSSISNRLIHDLHQLNLSEQHSKTLPKHEESRLRTDSGELGPAWSSISPSKWGNNNSSSHQQASNKSKFFDDFSSNNKIDQSQFNRSQQRWPSNTHSTQTSRDPRDHNRHYNEQEDESALPIRQPFFSNDRSYSQQQNRHQNGNMQYQQRYFPNNRRPQMPNQQRRPGGMGGGGNRETFNDNGYNYDNDFDFETSNRKFNKLASEDEFKQQSDSSNQFLPLQDDNGLTTEYAPLYDKKKSFFDNVTLEETSDAPAPMYNRSRNHDTFGNDRFQRQKNRGGGGGGAGYRRPNNNNNNYRQQQQGNEDFYYRQYNNNNNNGYHYRY